jgi:NADH dehydrogenase
MAVRVAVTGGTGFVGRHAVRALLDAGHEVVAIARGARRVYLPEKVTFVRADVTDGAELTKVFAGCNAVINLVAIINERGKRTFDRVNRVGSERVAAAAAEAGVRHLIQQSANGADPDPAYPYLLSKWAGEEAVIGCGVPFTVLRPSLIFGPGDGFFTLLARLIRLTPVTVIAGDGSALFQPISIDDVTRCMVLALERGPSNDVHAVGGPEYLSYDDIVGIIKRALGVHRFTMHMPVPMILPPAIVMQKVLPRPPVTVDQLHMLALNNITRLDSVQLAFGFEPAPFSYNADYLQDY